LRATFNTNRFLGVLGHILEHYDKALFGLLAPVLAPVFFGDIDPIFSLICTYMLIPLGMLMKPLGALVLGRIGDQRGKVLSLKLSIMGTAFATFCMGLVPSYASIGPMSSVFLIVCKLLQSFFAAAESASMAFVLIEKAKEKNKPLLSALIDASSIFGTLVAAGLIAVFSNQHLLQTQFRWLFFLSAISCFIPLFLKSEKIETSFSKRSIKEEFKSVFSDNKLSFLCSCVLFGFSSMTFHLVFNFMTGFVSQISQLKQSSLFHLNTPLLFIDIAAVIFFAFVSRKVKPISLMKASTLGLAIFSFYLFYFLPSAQTVTYITFQTVLILLGSCFCSILYAFCLEHLEGKSKLTSLALASSLGSQLIGAPCSSLCFWLYRVLKSPLAPAFYITFFSLLTFLSVLVLEKQKQKIKQLV